MEKHKQMHKLQKQIVTQMKMIFIHVPMLKNQKLTADFRVFKQYNQKYWYIIEISHFLWVDFLGNLSSWNDGKVI